MKAFAPYSAFRDSETEFAARYEKLPFVGPCFTLREYVRGVGIGQPKVYANAPALRRAFLRAVSAKS